MKSECNRGKNGKEKGRGGLREQKGIREKKREKEGDREMKREEKREREENVTLVSSEDS